MLLSDKDILKAIQNNSIVVKPFVKAMLQPSSIDVVLGSQFKVFNTNECTHIDPKIYQDKLIKSINVKQGEFFVLHPGEFALGSTHEIITLGSDIASRFEGKSSLGRLGLATHITAGFIDPGFSGHITVELANNNNLPIKLYPGMKIGQLAFFQLSSPVKNVYGQRGNHYQGQRGPTVSKTYDNFYIADVYKKGSKKAVNKR